MLTKIQIPVIDTESGKFEYGGNLSTRDFENMVYRNFTENDRKVQQFVDNMQYNSNNFSDGLRNERVNNRFSDENGDVEEKINYMEAEAFVQNSKKEDIGADFFKNQLEGGNMFIIILNLNPTSMEGDAESEVLFWKADSNRVLKDSSTTDEVKLKTLSVRNLKIEVENEYYTLKNCKIIQKQK